MVYTINYERPRPQSNYFIVRGHTNQYTFIVPLFDLELHGYFRNTQQQYLEKSQKTFDYLPEGTAKKSKQGIRYYGVKYTVLLPSSNPTPEQFIGMVERRVKDRFYTLKDLGQQVYRIDPINKTDEFYEQRHRQIRTRKIQDDKEEEEQRRKMKELDIKEKIKRGLLIPRRFNDSDGKKYFNPKEVIKPSKKKRRRFRSRSKSPPREPLKRMQKLKL